MVSSTLTTIVSQTSTGTNQHHHHHHHYPRQHQHQHQPNQPPQSQQGASANTNSSATNPIAGRNSSYYYNDLKTVTETNSIAYLGNSGVGVVGATTSGGTPTDHPSSVAAAPIIPKSKSLRNELSIIASASPPLSDQISLLFPKCRPKAGETVTTTTTTTTANGVQVTSPQPPPSTSSLSSESLSSVTPRISTNPFLSGNCNERASQQPSAAVASAGQTYFYNTPTSNGTAAGQDMPRKRNSYHYHHGSSSINTSNSNPNQNPFIRDNYWGEARHNTTPASTVLNSPELTEHESRNHHYLQKQQHHIRVGRSPVSHPDVQEQHSYRPPPPRNNSIELLDSPTRGMDVVADGEVVVFDDITENWQNLRVTTTDHNPLPNTNVGSTRDEVPEINNCETEAYKDHKRFLDRTFGINVDSRHGIIEYDGSPRRIGQGSPEEESNLPVNTKAHTNSMSPLSLYPARPGFPQRILSQPRESPPPMLLNAKQSSPSNNAEDTSNDVSEIGTSSDMTTSEILMAPAKSSTFDYLYEFSETRKVLEEFFKCPSNDEKAIENGSDVDSIDIQYEFHGSHEKNDSTYVIDVNQYLTADSPLLENNYHQERDVDCEEEDEEEEDGEEEIGDNNCSSPAPPPPPSQSLLQQQQHHHHHHNHHETIQNHNSYSLMNGDGHNHIGKDNTNGSHHDIDFFLDSASRSSGEPLDTQDGLNQNRLQSRNFRYSPETTDYDSNCGDLESLSGEFNNVSAFSNYAKIYASSMPVLEDGLSSGHTSDTENNNGHMQPMGISMLMDMKRMNECNASNDSRRSVSPNIDSYLKNDSPIKSGHDDLSNGRDSERSRRDREILGQSPSEMGNKVFKNIDPDLDSLYSISVFHRNDMVQHTPPPPAPAPHRKPSLICPEAIDLRPATLQRTKPTPVMPALEKSCRNPSQPPPIPERTNASPMAAASPIWIPRQQQLDSASNGLLEHDESNSKNHSADEEEVDTDLETDRLLGHQRLDDQGFYEDSNKSSWERKSRSLLGSSLSKFSSPKVQPSSQKSNGTSLLRQGLGTLLPTTPEIPPPVAVAQKQQQQPTAKLLDIDGSMSSPEHSDKSPEKSTEVQNMESPDGSTSGHMKKDSASSNGTGEKKVKKSKNKEGGAVLIEGVLFRARYLGSTQLVCEGQPTKSTRMMQAEEAVSRIKAPDGDAQPSTEVDLFISTEKIMVLNTDLKEIMMDHALRTISYIADIGDLVVLMARRRFVPQDIDDGPKPNRTPKMICHVFESDEAQFIAQSIGQAFQVAYMEFLKANGIEDHSFVKEMDYQEVLNSQEIFGDELEIFAKKELQKEVVVPKAKGEILGVVIVESGWGSMLPTVVIANLMSTGAAARCGQLNIGDQLIAINGLSLVGLPLSTCQNYIKNSKNQTVVKFTVVPCAPVVEVKIKRPNTKYQLGFSVQNGVICSLLRGGIAERGGVRVGHRIIEINNQSVVAVPHEKIVNLLATSVGEILMKTMPTSMFRLLTGQENPIYI